MAAAMENQEQKTSDNTNANHNDQSKGNELNTVSLLGNTPDTKPASPNSSSADQHLPGISIGDNSQHATASSDNHDKGSENRDYGSQEKVNENQNKGVEKVGPTEIKRDSEGNIVRYQTNGISLSKHDDGKWFMHNESGGDYVEIDEKSIKMEENGKVTYDENGFLAKSDLVLGLDGKGGLSGIFERPLDTVNQIAFTPLTTLDAVAHTNTIDVVKEIEKGAANEAIHNPKGLLKDAAVGALVTAATVATGGGFAVGLAIGVGTLAATELIKNKGDLGGIVQDGKDYINTLKSWGNDAFIIGSNGDYSEQEKMEAEQGLQQVGAAAAHSAADALGSKGVNAIAAVGKNIPRSVARAINDVDVPTVKRTPDAPPKAAADTPPKATADTPAKATPDTPANTTPDTPATTTPDTPTSTTPDTPTNTTPDTPTNTSSRGSNQVVQIAAPEWMEKHFPDASKVVNKDGSITWTGKESSGWTINTKVNQSGDLEEVYLLSPDGERVLRGLENPKIFDELLANGTADGTLAEQAALLRTRSPKSMHYLVLPKNKVTGIEDPHVYLDGAPNYFQDALDPQFIDKAKQLDIKQSAEIFEKHGMSPQQAEEYAQFVANRYRPDFAVTVNSPYSRSQELLHLHLDQIDPKVYGELAKIAEKDGFSTTTFKNIGDLVPGEAENLRAMWIPADAEGGLGDANPFKLVYESLPESQKGSIDQHSIALVPTKYQNSDGFLIIDGQASSNGAALEWLQHSTAWDKQGGAKL